MNTYDVFENVNAIVEEHLNDQFEMISAGYQNVGLDNRCGMIYISEDAIAVPKYNDGTLQYYGGFEYVNKDYRKEIGDYVFYLGEDNRVREHLDRFYGIEREEKEE